MMHTLFDTILEGVEEPEYLRLYRKAITSMDAEGFAETRRSLARRRSRTADLLRRALVLYKEANGDVSDNEAMHAMDSSLRSNG